MYAVYASDDILASVTEPSKPDLQLCCLVTCARNRGVRTSVVAIRRHVVVCRKLPTATGHALWHRRAQVPLTVVERRQLPPASGLRQHRALGPGPGRGPALMRRPAFAHGQPSVIFSRRGPASGPHGERGPAGAA